MFASRLSLARFIAIMTPTMLLGGAIASQYVGKLVPCEMCYWQRWPHLVAIGLALGAIAMRRFAGPTILFTALAALAIAVSGGIGVFHAGVEYHWWEGITACAAQPGGAKSGADLLAEIMAAPVIRCDVAQWTLFGLSLAGYNAILSLGAALAIAVLLLRGQT